MEKEAGGTLVEEGKEKAHKEPNPSPKSLKKKKKKEKKVEEIISEVRDKASDSEEPEFWMPPLGDRWDFDNGDNRWGSDSKSGQEDGDENGTGMPFVPC